ncbi:MAG: protein phosphatase 2C domain-containing protein [Myxococcales bacterium]|nr:protein phosphatase 2C domain-containing protein [Myxococcota bacterium]MDW8282435.1 protein phosphatase 2C domain-containing protein [Myxococcales bacterium]
MPEIRVRVAGATDVGLLREHNEDSFLVVDLDRDTAAAQEPMDFPLGPRGALLVVCDGMGGAAAGEVASALAVRGMRRLLAESLPGELGARQAAPEASPPPTDAGVAAQGLPAGDGASALSRAVTEKLAVQSDGVDAEVRRVAMCLRDAAYAVNHEIFAAACADLSKAGMGTTLTSVVLRRGRVVVAQVGDSRAYLWRRGRLTQITHDQSLVNSLLDSGQITQDQAKLFEHSNVILQALGVQEDVEVLLSTEQLRRGDRILLCSDGLVGVVSDEEIQQVMGQDAALPEVARALIEMARAAGGPDNITVIVAQVDGEGLPEPTEQDEVAYRPIALEDPAGRKTAKRELLLVEALPAFSLPAPSLPLSLASVLSMAWVVGLAVAGVVVGLLLYPQRPPSGQLGRGALCYFMVDSAEVGLVLDGERVGPLRSPGQEIRLGPGLHRVALWDPVRGAGPEEQVHVSPGQRCALRLRAPGQGGGP